MELNSLEVKILKLLSKQKAPVNHAFISKKCGECENTLYSLYNNNYIDCSILNDPVQLGFPSFEDTTITNDGREYLANSKIANKLNARSSRADWLKGIIITVVGGLILFGITQLIIA